MASGIDFSQAYQKAEKAYMQGKYQDAATAIDKLAMEYPEDPSVLLLRGHIYCYGMQQYDIATEQYRKVLNITSESEFVDYASSGLDYASQFSNGQGAGQFEEVDLEDSEDSQTLFDQGGLESDSLAASPEAGVDDSDLLQADASGSFSLDDSDLSAGDPFADSDVIVEDPFAMDSEALADLDDSFMDMGDNPFLAADDNDMESGDISFDTDDNPFASLDGEALGSTGTSLDASDPFDQMSATGATVDAPGVSDLDLDLEEEFVGDMSQNQGFADSTEQTLFMGDSSSQAAVHRDWDLEAIDQEDKTVFAADPVLDPEEDAFSEVDQADLPDYSNNGMAMPDSMETDQSGSNVDFLDEFSEFDDLGSLPDFELSDSSAGFTSPAVGPSGLSSTDDDTAHDLGTSAFDLSDMSDQSVVGEDEIFL